MGKEEVMAREDDMTGVMADDVEDLYRSSEVKCGVVICREVPRT